MAAVSKRLRYEILRRDNHRCRYCGATAPDVPLRVDHVLPVALGGSDDPSNLVAACHDCNAGKASCGPDESLVADVSEDAIRWARAIEAASAILAAETKEQQVFAVDFYGIWDACLPDEADLPRDWEDQLRKFRARGLSKQALIDAFWITESKSRTLAPESCWRYFCGVCWRRLDQLTNMARALLAVEDGDA